MPTIRIDNEVWQALQKRATPFEDSPNDVLRRVLGIDTKTGLVEPRQRAARMPKYEYRRPILEALVELGGGGQVTEVLDRVRDKIGPTLKSADRQKVSGGEEKWRNRARWVRGDMVEEGLLKPGSPRGTWEITEKGRKYLGGAPDG